MDLHRQMSIPKLACLVECVGVVDIGTAGLRGSFSDDFSPHFEKKRARM